MAKASLSFKIHGLGELMNALEQLPTLSMQKGVVRRALEKAAVPVQDAAKINAQLLPFDSKKIADSIRIGQLKKSQRPKGRRDRTTVTRYIGSSHPLAHLFEFGTGERETLGLKTMPAGLKRGYIPAMPFLRPAWDANKVVVLERLKVELWAAIQRSARQLARKAERGTLTARQIEGLRRR